MFGAICNKLHISRQIMKITNLSLNRSACRFQLGIEIEIRDLYSTYFDITNLMAISDLANELLLKFSFFEVSPIVSICMNFQ